MTKDEFITWLNWYLDKCAADQIKVIREKLDCVQGLDRTSSYMSGFDPNKTDIAK